MSLSFDDAYANLLDEVWEIQNNIDDNAYFNGLLYHDIVYQKILEKFGKESGK